MVIILVTAVIVGAGLLLAIQGENLSTARAQDKASITAIVSR
jgi:hypothetical protein